MDRHRQNALGPVFRRDDIFLVSAMIWLEPSEVPGSVGGGSGMTSMRQFSRCGRSAPGSVLCGGLAAGPAWWWVMRQTEPSRTNRFVAIR